MCSSDLADGILENEISVAPEKCLRPQEQWWLERHQQIFDRTEPVSYTHLDVYKRQVVN